MRVAESGGDADLAQEPLRAKRLGEFRMQNLYRDDTVMTDVAGTEDAGHAATSLLALDVVAAGECGAYAVGQAGQVSALEGGR